MRRVERETHDAVRRRGAADKALDLALLSMRSLVRLGAGDGRRPCRYKQQNTSVYRERRPKTMASSNSESLENVLTLCRSLEHKNTP